MHPLVSIIIPSFNSSSFIKKTLVSIREQTIKQFEVIIIDDCSHDFDELFNVVKELNDLRISVYKGRTKLFGGGARDLGVRMARGDVVCFCDADDLWSPDKLEKQLAFLKPMSVIGNQIQVVRVSNNQFFGRPRNVFSSYNPELSIIENLFGKLKHNLIFQTSSLMLFKRDYLSFAGFNRDFRRHQDYQFLIDAEKSGFNFYFHPEPLSVYVKEVRRSLKPNAWTIDHSRFFLARYSEFFSKKCLFNFLITQLFGPALRSRALGEWLELAAAYNISRLRLACGVLVYITKRLIN